MKWTILLLFTLITANCMSSKIKDEVPVKKAETAPEKIEENVKNYLDISFAKENLIQNKTDPNAIARAKALVSEANTLVKLKKNDEAILKFEESFELGTDPEAYYRYGNALSNIQKLNESIEAYDIAIELGYEKDYYAIYNKACSFSLLKKSDESFKNILLSVDKGYKAIPYMQEDPDLEYVRSLPEWKSKYREIKKHAKERNEMERNKG